MGLTAYDLRMAAIQLIVLICSLALHEWGHAFVADRLGDDTPRREGRVTLNPRVHIDPIGTILIPLLGILGMFGRIGVIGWAKPVYTNPANFRRGYFDQALVTLAGPGMNLALAIAATVIGAIVQRQGLQAVDLFRFILEVNVTLAVFNMLPIPPLDGSKFLIYWGAIREETYVRISMFGGILLLILINIPAMRTLFMKAVLIGRIPFVYLGAALGWDIWDLGLYGGP